jgi:hypothetical protein
MGSERGSCGVRVLGRDGGLRLDPGQLLADALDQAVTRLVLLIFSGFSGDTAITTASLS